MNVLFDIIKSNIIIINEKLYINIERTNPAVSLFVIIIAIDKTAEINERIFDVMMDTNVSPTTCFSISLLLSSFPTRMAAKPNNTVNTNNTVNSNNTTSGNNTTNTSSGNDNVVDETVE